MILGSTLLEVAIGVIFVYLLVSLLCSALNELIEALLKYRATYLKRGITKLLGNEDLANEFFDHPLVSPLGERPSYVTARTFSLTLWSLVTREAAKAADAAAGLEKNIGNMRDLIGELDDAKYGRLKVSLLTLMDEAGGDLDKTRASIEAWYDDAMDRVSGWYKRHTHFILIVLGLLAAFALNVDTVYITKALMNDDTLRKTVADSAQKYVTENTAPASANANANGAGNGGAAAAAEQDPQAQAIEATRKLQVVRGQLEQLGLPIGWPVPPNRNDQKYVNDPKAKDPQAGEKLLKADEAIYEADPRWWPAAIGWWGGQGFWLKLFGLILTGLAVSQGAPFWFDLLNKFMVVRSTVKPREKSRPEGSKDKTDDKGEDEGEGERDDV
jgi:hypothetical protein